MQTRMVKPELVRDDWFASLTPDEKWFFTYFLISPDILFAGIGNVPDRIIALDTGFTIETVQHLKQRMEKSKKIIFFNGWVCIVNFFDHNPMLKIPDVQTGAGRQIKNLPPKVFAHFNTKLKEMEAPMSLDDYLEKRRRNQTKKAVRKNKPWLQGAQLDQEVDRVLGVADSGKMDWATVVESGQPASQYQTPESTFPHIDRLAKQYGVLQSALYWQFKRKILKYQGSGRTKHDYLAVLEECATKIKPMKRSERVQAVVLYSAEVLGEPMTTEQADAKLMSRGDIE